MKSKRNSSLIVFSTDRDFKPLAGEEKEQETVSPALQKLQILLDKKKRAGKSVTLVINFLGSQVDLENLGKNLKAFCGTGGSVKDGEIIIQGDNREKVFQWLQKQGYTGTRKS